MPSPTLAEQLAAAQALITQSESAAVDAVDALLAKFVTDVRAIALPPASGFPSQVSSFIKKTADNAEAARTNELAVIKRYYTPFQVV